MSFKCDGCDKVKPSKPVRWGTLGQYLICKECLPRLKKIRKNLKRNFPDELSASDTRAKDEG